MTADQRGEPGQQRTVAELLKQYGADEPAGGRRRRRASKPDEPPSGPPAQRSEEPDAALGAGQSYSGHGTAGDQADPWARPAGYGTDRGNGTGGLDSYALDAGNGAPERPHDSGFTDSGLRGGSDWSSPGPTGTGSYPAQPASGTGAFPPAGTGAFPPAGTGSFPTQAYQGDIYRSGLDSPTARPEESTDFIPKFGQRPGRGVVPAAEPSEPPTSVSPRADVFGDQADAAGPTTTGPHTAISSPAEMFGDHADDEDTADPDVDGLDEPAPAGFLGRRLSRRGAAEPADSGAEAGAGPVGLVDDDVPAGLTERDDPDEVERAGRPTGFKVWLSLIGQWVLGAIGGAALWIGFSYLWLNYPVVALAAAVLATAGLVLLVRAIRRSDDLQTTMLAVLVGLVVTISPAVLQLAGR
ncbi:MAG TPA: hypothetical protein VGH89_15930 [Pseudonocardia sp.]|jgi:hypothetical protein